MAALPERVGEPPQACAVPAAAACEQMLPGYEFADAFAVVVAGPLDATQAVTLAFGRSPAWVQGLMSLRNRAMGLFGLRAAPAGGFPVVRSSPDGVWLGFDDAHLDFRVAVTTEPCVQGTRVTTTTMVRPHNRWGRGYLRLVLPFHRRIVPEMLRGVAAAPAR